MTCPLCRRTEPADSETGYDGLEICPACVDEGGIEVQRNGQTFYVLEQDLCSCGDPECRDEPDMACNVRLYDRSLDLY